MASVVFWRKYIIIFLIQRLSIPQLDVLPLTGCKFGLLVAMVTCSTRALLSPLILFFGDGRHEKKEGAVLCHDPSGRADYLRAEAAHTYCGPIRKEWTIHAINSSPLSFKAKILPGQSISFKQCMLGGGGERISAENEIEINEDLMHLELKTR